MDYEAKIKQLEIELRRERELGDLYSQRLTTHDKTFDSLRETLDATIKVQQTIVVDLAKLTLNVHQLTLNVDKLVAAITRDHSNGKS
jgi:alanine dehydrogenase